MLWQDNPLQGHSPQRIGGGVDTPGAPKTALKEHSEKLVQSFCANAFLQVVPHTSLAGLSNTQPHNFITQADFNILYSHLGTGWPSAFRQSRKPRRSSLSVCLCYRVYSNFTHHWLFGVLSVYIYIFFCFKILKNISQGAPT